MKLENVTKGSSARWYDDACGTAMALELVGERWSLLVVRELMFGPRRFGELKANLGGISANVLTQRLEGLARAGILIRRTLPSPSSVQVYELTPWGYESETAIRELGRWAARSPAHDPTLSLSAASLMLSFRTMFSRQRADGWAAVVGFRLGGEGFVGRIEIGYTLVGFGEGRHFHVGIDSEHLAHLHHLVWCIEDRGLAAVWLGIRDIGHVGLVFPTALGQARGVTQPRPFPEAGRV